MDAGNYHTFHKYTSVQFVIFYSMVYSQYIRPKATYTAKVKCTYVLAYSCTMIHNAVYVAYVQWSPLCIYMVIMHGWALRITCVHLARSLCDSLLPYICIMCVCTYIYKYILHDLFVAAKYTYTFAAQNNTLKQKSYKNKCTTLSGNERRGV